MEINNNELDELVFLSFRYALGRRTYITHTVAHDYISKYWDILKDSTKDRIKKEIKEAIEADLAGDSCDIDNWKTILNL